VDRLAWLVLVIVLGAVLRRLIYSYMRRRGL
jgi:hypothetical protein